MRSLIAARAIIRSAAAAVLAVALASPAAPAADPAQVTLHAVYVISISGITIGRAEVKARFTDRGYAAAISGSTYGVSRFVSDASATLAGSGRVVGMNVVPASYNLESDDSGFDTSVSMTMHGGSVIGLRALPNLPEVDDRVPFPPDARQNVVDPVGAFVVPLDHVGATPDGDKVCDRTVRVFDGWKRFDVRLAYKESHPGDNGGTTIVCSARYVPVAGHRTSDTDVTYMANNTRIEVSLSAVPGTRYLVPSRVLIGTKLGDLVVNARTFEIVDESQQAEAG